MRSAIILSLAAIAALATPAGAAHCTTWSTTAAEAHAPATGVSYTGNDGEYYIDLVICNIGCIVNFWIYEEANGIDGLQRGDEVVDDTCHSQILPDRVIL